MKHFLTYTIILFVNTVALAQPAKSVKCRVDDRQAGGQKIEVPVTIIKGAVESPDNSVTLNGHKFAVIWQQGDAYESQTRLSMVFGNNTSMMSNFKPQNYQGQINSIYFEDLRFQCWTE